MSKFLDESGLSYFWSKLKTMFSLKADSATGANGVATKAAGIPYGEVDATSTKTAFTATIEGITSYYDGLTVMLKNGVVTSAANFTININGLGAKAAYSSMGTGYGTTAPTRESTLFNINYTMLFIYSEDIVSGGGWILYRGYDANTNTIGYQLRSNSFSLPMDSIVYRYRLLFQSADNTKWIPANNSTSTNATAARTVCQGRINPFGAIVYYGTTASVAAGSRPSAANLWQQYAFTLGYSFQESPNYVLTAWKPVYLKCAPQTDGSAIIDADVPFVQDLPSTEDGKIYILLGYAYSETAMELVYYHPVYHYKDGMIRLYTTAQTGGGGGAVDSVNGQTGVVVLDAEDVGALPDDTVIPTKTSDLTNDSGFVTSSGVTSIDLNTSAEPYDLPIVNGKATLDIGDGLAVSDSNGVELKHKTGAGYKHIPSGGSAGQFLGYSSNGVASWQNVPTPTVPSPSSTAPSMDGTASAGSSANYARADHVHPTDTSRQALLVSGQNIKTINNESLLGSGNIDIQGGGTALTDAEVEAAVDAAMVATTYTITKSGNKASSVLIHNGDFITELTEASAGTTIYITNDSSSDIYMTGDFGTATIPDYDDITVIMPAQNVSAVFSSVQPPQQEL